MMSGNSVNLDDELSNPYLGGDDKKSPVQKMQDKEQELSLKEQELLRREAELAQRETQMQRAPQSSSGVDVLGQLVAALNKNKTDDVVFPDQILDPDDVIEKGERFFCYSFFHVVTHDIKFRRIVYPPDNAGLTVDEYKMRLIEFKSAASIKTQYGRAEDIIQIAIFTSYSKRVSAWLRNHSKYGVEFFDYEKYGHMSITQGNVNYSRRLAAIMTTLEGKSANQLAVMCNTYQVSPSSDKREMAASIAEKMITAEFRRDNSGNWVPINAHVPQSIQTITKEELMAVNEAKERDYALARAGHVNRSAEAVGAFVGLGPGVVNPTEPALFDAEIHESLRQKSGQ